MFEDWKQLFADWKRVVTAPAVPVTWAVLSTLTAVAGPFGSYEALPLAMRAIYWPVLIGLGILVGSAVRMLVETWLASSCVWWRSVLVAAINVVLFTPPLLVIIPWMGGPGSDDVPNAMEFAFFVFIASLGVGAVRNVMAVPPATTATVPPPPGDSPAALPRLIARLPEPLQAPLVRLSVRDHYVVVHTALGTETLLMRFADAMAEVDGVDGLQIHRSHWVAAPEVEQVVRRGGRTLVVMRDGAEVPVSRAFQAEVAARWPR